MIWLKIENVRNYIMIFNHKKTRCLYYNAGDTNIINIVSTTLKTATRRQITYF